MEQLSALMGSESLISRERYILSASDRMMLGLFPPSSSVTFFRLVLPAACWIR